MQIPLGGHEGGLNLNMDPEVIARMVNKGKEAGKKLRDDFVFDHHRWVRLRTLMNEIETNLKGISRELDPTTVGRLFEAQRETPDDRRPFPYRMDDAEWCAKAQRRVEQLADLVEDWKKADGEATFFQPVTTAEPEPELRVTPNV